MGWFGYGIYDGDDTQTRHYDFIKWSGVKVDDDEIGEWMGLKGTKIPSEYQVIFVDGINKVLKKIKSDYDSDDDIAIEYQMLLALYLDNNLRPPKIVKEKGIEGAKHLMGEHASDFDNPGTRRKALRNFIAKAKKVKSLEVYESRR
jgi:hypothetical protein